MLTDHLSELLLCSSEPPRRTSRASRSRAAIEVVGDVMVDVALRRQPRRARTTGTLADALACDAGEYLL